MRQVVQVKLIREQMVTFRKPAVAMNELVQLMHRSEVVKAS